MEDVYKINKLFFAGSNEYQNLCSFCSIFIYQSLFNLTYETFKEFVVIFLFLSEIYPTVTKTLTPGIDLFWTLLLLLNPQWHCILFVLKLVRVATSIIINAGTWLTIHLWSKDKEQRNILWNRKNMKWSTIIKSGKFLRWIYLCILVYFSIQIIGSRKYKML